MKNIEYNSVRENEFHNHFTTNFNPEIVKRHKKLQRIWTSLLLIFIFICFMLYLIGVNNPEYESLSNFLMFFLLATLCYYFLIFFDIPFSLILAKVTLRTKNWHFAFQLIFHALFAIYLVFAPIFFITQDNLYAVMNKLPPIFILPLGFLLVLLFYCYPLFFVIRSRGDRRSLLSYDISKGHSNIKPTLLMSQAVKIDSIEDGYSQRALFSEFNGLSNFFTSSEEFRVLGENYVKFLGKKGMIIDWEITNTAIKLYPRFLTTTLSLIYTPLGAIRLLNNVRRRENLTEIEISYNPPQTSIRVALADYEIIAREVTFHLLGQEVVKRIKQSLVAFLNDDLEVACNILFENA